MAIFVFGNFFATEILESISASATTIRVSAVQSQKLPFFAAADNKEARLTIWDGVHEPEIVGCTENLQTGTLTVTRAKEDTTAFPWAAGAQVKSSLTQDVINQALDFVVQIDDILNANFLKLAGGTLTGPLVLAADPVVPLGAATRQYVDAHQSAGLPLTGGTMTGPINMDHNEIQGLPEPTNLEDAATKNYVDTTKTSITNRLLDQSATLVTSGTVNPPVGGFAAFCTGFTLTGTSVPWAAYFTGLEIATIFHVDNGPNPTLDLNTIGAKRILLDTAGNTPPTGYLRAGHLHSLVFNGGLDGGVGAWLVDGAVAPAIIAGDLKHSVLATDHDRWLVADGRAVPRTGQTFGLFAACGANFGNGDGVTTFNIPDARGRVLGMIDTVGTRLNFYAGSNATGTVIGAQTHVLTVAELPTHTPETDPAGAGGGINLVFDAITPTGEVNQAGQPPHTAYQPTGTVSVTLSEQAHQHNIVTAGSLFGAQIMPDGTAGTTHQIWRADVAGSPDKTGNAITASGNITSVSTTGFTPTAGRQAIFLGDQFTPSLNTKAITMKPIGSSTQFGIAQPTLLVSVFVRF